MCIEVSLGLRTGGYLNISSACIPPFFCYTTFTTPTWQEWRQYLGGKREMVEQTYGFLVNEFGVWSTLSAHVPLLLFSDLVTTQRRYKRVSQ